MGGQCGVFHRILDWIGSYRPQAGMLKWLNGRAAGQQGKGPGPASGSHPRRSAGRRKSVRDRDGHLLRARLRHRAKEARPDPQSCPARAANRGRPEIAKRRPHQRQRSAAHRVSDRRRRADGRAPPNRSASRPPRPQKPSQASRPAVPQSVRTQRRLLSARPARVRQRRPGGVVLTARRSARRACSTRLRFIRMTQPSPAAPLPA